MMTPSGSGPVMARVVEKRSALEGARKTSGPLQFGDGPDGSIEFGDIDPELLERLMAEDDDDPPAERIRQASARPERRVVELMPAEWEELTQTESGYLLRHDGRLFAAREIDAEGVVAAVFASPPLVPAKSKPEAPPAPKPRGKGGKFAKADPTQVPVERL